MKITSEKKTMKYVRTRIKSNQIIFICDTKQNINDCDIIIRQMCRQDTKAVLTALTGALGLVYIQYVYVVLASVRT